MEHNGLGLKSHFVALGQKTEHPGPVRDLCPGYAVFEGLRSSQRQKFIIIDDEFLVLQIIFVWILGQVAVLKELVLTGLKILENFIGML